MSSWPDKPLIRIIRGTEYSEAIDGYQRLRRAWWPVVPTDQYSFIKFL